MINILRKGARMHLPRVIALPALFMLIAGMSLGLLGCAGESEAPLTPLEISITDIPFDDGSSAVVSWRHFDASSARRYDFYYSTDPESLEQHIEDLEPISRSQQEAIYEVQDSNACKLIGPEYYLVLEETDGEAPVAMVVEATPETRDSLKQIGELIVGTESGFCPNGRDNRELKFAKGKFFRVQPSEEQLENVQRTLAKTTLKADSTGLSLGEGRGGLILELSPAQAEIEFVKAGERIVPYSDKQSDLLFKYGHEVVAIITEDSRYSISSDIIQAYIVKKLEAGKEYHYKVIAVNEKGDESEPATGTFTPQDEPPMPPAGAMAVLDSTDGRLLMTWMGFNPGLAYFRDVDHYEILRYSPEDSLQEGGEVLATLNADFERHMLSGNFGEEDMFYIASLDNAGQRSPGEPFGLEMGTFEEPGMVRNLGLHDVINDDGSGLSVRWGVPTAGITLNVQDFTPEYSSFNVPEGYYLFDGELVTFEDDSLIPEQALPVKSARQWVPPEAYTVTFRYDIYSNDNEKIYYGKLRVDEGEWTEDYKELGFINLTDFPAGEHVFEVWLLDKNGRELENPEAHVTRTFTINQPGLLQDEDDGEYVEIWRGNEAVEEKDELLLEATPNFDPKTQTTFEMVGQRGVLENQHQDNWPDSLRDVGSYYYFARVIGPDGSYKDSEILGPMTPTSNYFHTEKTIVLVLVILFVIFVNYFLAAARKGKDFYLRPIAGISHLDEALGRATEMGRPILYVLGLTGISDIATLAGLTILGRVAKKTAEFQTRLIVPCYDPIVLIIAQETVKTAYMDAGRPDAYNEDDVFYAAGSQFSYAAAVAGMMVRFKTAANFYMGMFFAESLILTETGSLSGSIQIAGTDAVTQIPFFITTCDYTLIGEEIYAASAYLSQDPLQVGSLKAQDMLKAIYMAVIVIGTISMTSGFLWFINLFKVRLGE